MSKENHVRDSSQVIWNYVRHVNRPPLTGVHLSGYDICGAFIYWSIQTVMPSCVNGFEIILQICFPSSYKNYRRYRQN